MGEEKRRGVDACILCGRCNEGDEAYLSSLGERRSPRHLVWSCRNGRQSMAVYAHMLNGRADALCPVAVDIEGAILAARRKLVRDGRETIANRELIAKLKEGKNPYK